MKTPTLLLLGAQDLRVPVSNGIQVRFHAISSSYNQVQDTVSYEHKCLFAYIPNTYELVCFLDATTVNYTSRSVMKKFKKFFDLVNCLLNFGPKKINFVKLVSILKKLSNLDKIAGKLKMVSFHVTRMPHEDFI